MIEKWIDEFEDLWLGWYCDYISCWAWCKEKNEELFLKAEQQTKQFFKYNNSELNESDDETLSDYDEQDRYNAIRSTLDYWWEYYGYNLDYEEGLTKK